MSMSMISLSVFLDGCCWLYYSVLLDDVDVGIVSQHHCHHYLSLRLSLLACTIGCLPCWLPHVLLAAEQYIMLMQCCCLHTYYWYRSLGTDILVVELL